MSRQGATVRRRICSPIEIRRIAYALMALAAVAGGWSGAEVSPVGMIFVCILVIAATVCYVRAADILLDFDFRSVRRQAVLFAIVGLSTATIGCAVASQLVDDRSENLVRAVGYAGISGGIAVGLSGLVAMLWSFTGTYAGQQIEKRSQEEW